MNAPLATTPRIRNLSDKRSATVCVLDIGTTKITCLIAQLNPLANSERLPGRTHRCKILGIGLQPARGIRRGLVVEMDQAEDCIRHTLDAAERMARVQVQGVIINVSGGRIGSRHCSSEVELHGQPVGASQVHRVLEKSNGHLCADSRVLLHALPIGFSVDGAIGIREPRGMVGVKLGAAVHSVSCEAAAMRNLTLVVERCHLDIEAIVASPYASGLSVLVDDEAELGATVIDFGGGTTSMACFAGGRLVHADGIAVGGSHVTNDIARGLTLCVADAERLKTHYGACSCTGLEEFETLSISQIGDEGGYPVQIPKQKLVSIIQPRVEEILELVRDRLAASGRSPGKSHRIVLTGGAAQLPGLREMAQKILSNQVRIGRPLGIQGLPESAKNPAFAAAAGLLVYPQMAGIEYFESQSSRRQLGTGTDGYIGRVGKWLRDSF